MCKLEVAGNKLGSLPGKGDYYHLHIIFTDDDGNKYGMRGGPSGSPGFFGSSGQLFGGSSRGSSRGSSGSGTNSSNASASSGGGGPYGYIVTEVTPYDEEFIDYPHDGETLPVTTIAEGPEVCEKFDELKKQMQMIQDSKTRYNPLGPNSNSTVFTALKNVGLTPKTPDGVWAPGATDEIKCVLPCKGD